MKKSIIYTLSLLAAAATFFACEKQNTPEPVRTQFPSNQSPIVRDNAYYARLRAYKQTPHELAFGWYGSWTAIGSSEQTRLQSAPDSMDIISIWSTWHSLTKEQMADKAFVQQTLGTKVVFCISAKDVPAVFREGGVADGAITEESLVAYAKAWGKDSMDKYQYDGMDIDFETAIDHIGDLNKNPEFFKKFCTELSKYIGPASGTGRLFIIDGNFDASLFPLGLAELCNYAVGQAYGTSQASQLDRRVTSAATRGWKNEQMIFTENFESMWQSGGNSYTCTDGVVRPSLLGMADYAKTTPAVGFGSYHMEYEYGNSVMPYKYIRQAIQLANPAPMGDYSKILVSINETKDEKYNVVLNASGGQVTTVEIKTPISAYLASVAPSETNIPLMVDNSLVAEYNDFYFTQYKTVDPSIVHFSAPLHFVSGTLKSDNSVEITIPDFSSLADGDYLIPIGIDISKAPGFSYNTAKRVKYIFITKSTSLDA